MGGENVLNWPRRSRTCNSVFQQGYPYNCQNHPHSLVFLDLEFPILESLNWLSTTSVLLFSLAFLLPQRRIGFFSYSFWSHGRFISSGDFLGWKIQGSYFILNSSVYFRFAEYSPRHRLLCLLALIALGNGAHTSSSSYTSIQRSLVTSRSWRMRSQSRPKRS